MSIQNDLRKSIFSIIKRNNDGSYATQADRRTILTRFSKDLVSLKYGLRDIYNLKEKHILAVIKFWKEKKLKTSTIQNRMAVLRYLAKKINKPNLIPANNKLGIERRTYIPVRNRAFHDPSFSKINNQYVRVSLELQRVFGLRREESLKIKPHVADKGDKLELLSSWCKGGRGRVIPIRTEEQRYWLEQAKNLARKFNHSLIPENKNYIRQRYVYEKQVARAGLKNMHGLRHAYAQQRYKELTGWDAPINGGPKSCDLTREQKQIDYKARMILTEELGHSREQITVNYLSR
ncbi:MAG: phage integrase N-terminal domain-containing protein [Gammaproteobacteria bacterium]